MKLIMYGYIKSRHKSQDTRQLITDIKTKLYEEFLFFYLFHAIPYCLQ